MRTQEARLSPSQLCAIVSVEILTIVTQQCSATSLEQIVKRVGGGRKGIHPACEKLSGGVLASGVVIFLEQDANLQTYGAGDATALTVSCFSKIQIGTGSPGQSWTKNR